MDAIFLDAISFQPDLPTLLQRLHIRADSPDAADFQNYAHELAQVARPKVFYKLAFIDRRSEREVVMDGVSFQSRVLCVNLAEVQRVFAYLATCGMEMEEKSQKETDILRRFWADAVCEAALRSALQALTQDLATRYQTAKMAVMNPGSLEDWPIAQQRPFFDLLGPDASRTGVTLTDSMLMIPSKSTTGLYFETESGFVNCQLCPRQTCPNRHAPYRPELFKA